MTVLPTTAGLAVTAVLLTLVDATWAVIAVGGTVQVTALAPVRLRSEALGVFTAAGALAGGLLGGWLAARDYLLAFAVAGGLLLVGTCLVVAAIRVGATTPAPRPTEGGERL